MKNKKLLIRAHGFGFYVCLFMCLSLVALGIFTIVMVFIVDEEGFHTSAIAIIIYFLTTIGMTYETVMLFKKGKVEFDGEKFINSGKYTSFYPPFKVKCSDIIACRIVMLGFQFTFANRYKKKEYFHTLQFSKKQLQQILNEIKARGGLQDQEIDIDILDKQWREEFKAKRLARKQQRQANKAKKSKKKHSKK